VARVAAMARVSGLLMGFTWGKVPLATTGGAGIQFPGRILRCARPPRAPYPF
jgi:hypothetical protein